jgi:hypothetical protein
MFNYMFICSLGPLAPIFKVFNCSKTPFSGFFLFLLPQISASLRYEQVPLGWRDKKKS